MLRKMLNTLIEEYGLERVETDLAMIKSQDDLIEDLANLPNKIERVRHTRNVTKMELRDCKKFVERHFTD